MITDQCLQRRLLGGEVEVLVLRSMGRRNDGLVGSVAKYPYLALEYRILTWKDPRGSEPSGPTKSTELVLVCTRLTACKVPKHLHCRITFKLLLPATVLGLKLFAKINAKLLCNNIIVSSTFQSLITLKRLAYEYAAKKKKYLQVLATLPS